METSFFPHEDFNPDSFLNEAAITRAPLMWADSRLGRPIVGFKNPDGHALFLIQAKKGGGFCEQCRATGDADYILEEVDHTGSTHNMALVCRDCVPQSMWPQGD